MMVSGVGFQELLLIGLLIFLLFGAKGMGGVMRDLGRWTGKLKKYRDEFTSEIMKASETQKTVEEIRRDERALIRKHTKNALNALTPEDRKRESEIITKTIIGMEEYKSASSLFIFLSLPEEFETGELVANALSCGKKVYVPYCKPDTKEIKITQITDVNKDIVQGHYRIPEPRPELQSSAPSESPVEIDCLIVPGLAFDHECTRLGRGAGYFDRFLPPYKNKSPILCPALSAQMYHYTIPREPHDVMPDAVITEKDVLRPAKIQ